MTADRIYVDGQLLVRIERLAIETEEPFTRDDLRHILKLSRRTAYRAVKRLLGDGVLVQIGKRKTATKSGKPPALLTHKLKELSI